MSSPIPVILWGKSTQIGQGVITALKPDYEVIHFIQSASRGVIELPYLLKGEAPPPRTDEAADESNIGSKNYAETPKAIILGGGLTDDDIAQMRQACEGFLTIPWIRPDLVKMTERCKVTLKELREKGEMGKDGVYWY